MEVQQFELRNGQPFCKKCNQQMLELAVNEMFVAPGQPSGRAFQCEKCGQTVIAELPPP
jgi:hypothetical protein